MLKDVKRKIVFLYLICYNSKIEKFKRKDI